MTAQLWQEAAEGSAERRAAGMATELARELCAPGAPGIYTFQDGCDAARELLAAELCGIADYAESQGAVSVGALARVLATVFRAEVADLVRGVAEPGGVLADGETKRLLAIGRVVEEQLRSSGLPEARTNLANVEMGRLRIDGVDGLGRVLICYPHVGP